MKRRAPTPSAGQRPGGRRSGCTFHCRPRVLLERWVSFGDDGTSGTLQCVVKEPASELDPRTELYVADTLKQKVRISTFGTGGEGGEPRFGAKSSPDVIVCRWP